MVETVGVGYLTRPYHALIILSGSKPQGTSPWHDVQEVRPFTAAAFALEKSEHFDELFFPVTRLATRLRRRFEIAVTTPAHEACHLVSVLSLGWEPLIQIWRCLQWPNQLYLSREWVESEVPLLFGALGYTMRGYSRPPEELLPHMDAAEPIRMVQVRFLNAEPDEIGGSVSVLYTTRSGPGQRRKRTGAS